MDYIDFQDRTAPIAYFITFSCYGTWLHGDNRTSVDRKDNNGFGAPRIQPNKPLRDKEFATLKHPPFKLDKAAREVVRAAIREVCSTRNYTLFAVNVRSTHVHAVTSTNSDAETILNTFKAYATRRLRASGLIAEDRKIWTRHGSTRYLWTQSQVGAAIDYVLYCQDFGMPEF